MTIANYRGMLQEARFSKNDREWFPHWIRR
jgi:hypothetical protein